MTKHFNQLSPSEAERLAILAEEAGEVVQIVGKILRHGLDSHHPDDPSRTNRMMLENEICDFYAAVSLMCEQGDIPYCAALDDHINKKLRYAHHQ